MAMLSVETLRKYITYFTYILVKPIHLVTHTKQVIMILKKKQSMAITQSDDI